MRFRTYTKRGEISLDASIYERAELIAFIDTSLTRNQIDDDEHFPVDRDVFRGLREAISAQSFITTEPLIVPHVAFWDLVKVAYAWHAFGYRGASESAELDVPRAIVNAIHILSDEAPMYIDPSEP